jgi:DNA-binding transcriptional LysR family regulator
MRVRPAYGSSSGYNEPELIDETANVAGNDLEAGSGIKAKALRLKDDGRCSGSMIENFRMTVFRAVAHHLNFSRAAETLLLTQPAVTQQIKALEEEVGFPLFDRAGGRISLTPGGIALLPFAEKLKAISDEALAAVASAYGELAGELSLGGSQTIAQYLLPHLIAGFLQRHPNVSMTVRSGNTDEMVGALLSGDVQLALLEGPVVRSDLHIESFMKDRMVLVVPASHEWAGETIKLDELKTQPLLTREVGSGSRRIVEQALAAAGMKAKDISIRMELDSTEGLLSAVEAGLGVTFVSRWAVRNQLALGTLKLTRIEGLTISRNFSLAYPTGPEPSGSAGAFRRFLLSQEALSPRHNAG